MVFLLSARGRGEMPYRQPEQPYWVLMLKPNCDIVCLRDTEEAHARARGWIFIARERDFLPFATSGDDAPWPMQPQDGDCA